MAIEIGLTMLRLAAPRRKKFSLYEMADACELARQTLRINSRPITAQHIFYLERRALLKLRAEYDERQRKEAA